jgi:O-antigen/teichoic acid export membrane protein
MIKDTGRILIADLIVAVTAFLTLSIAPFVLSTEQLARMSLIIAAGMVLIIALDLGLGTSAIKRYAEAGEDRWLHAMAGVKMAVFLIALPIAAVLWMFPGGDFFALALLVGAGMNLWGGLRILDSARQRFDSYLGSNLKLAAFRAVIVPPALLAASPAAIIAALFAAPVAILCALRARHEPQMLRLPDQATRAGLFSYAPAVYISSVAYSALPYLPQLVLNARFDAASVASYGIVMTFIAPFNMVLVALRTYLTPRILKQTGEGFSTPFSFAGAKLLTITLGLGLGAVAGLTVLIQLVYGAKYPQAAQLFAGFSFFFVMTSMVGLFNIRLHAHSLPHLDMTVNIARLAAAAVLLWLFAHSALAVAMITGAVMLIGEVALLFWVEHRVRRIARTAPPALEAVSK